MILNSINNKLSRSLVVIFFWNNIGIGYRSICMIFLIFVAEVLNINYNNNSNIFNKITQVGSKEDKMYTYRITTS